MLPQGTLILAALVLAYPHAALPQATGSLHIKVVLVDAEQKAMPVPRHVLLISDNPASAPPRRVITALDGTADVTLRPGNYTIESDQPVAFQGKSYEWMQIVDIVAGRTMVLELTDEECGSRHRVGLSGNGVLPRLNRIHRCC